MPIEYPGAETFHPNVEIYDETDDVLGGAGVDADSNRPHKQTADRTAWLKQANDRMVGMVADFAAASAPSGWLEADGSRLLRTSYPLLFAVSSFDWGIRFNETTTANTFTATNRVGDVVATHPFNTTDAVNIKQTNADSTAVVQDGGVDVTPTDTVYVRKINDNQFTLHPTASDATNDTNSLTAVNFDANNGFVIEYTDQFSLPDLRGRLTKGIGSTVDDFEGKEEKLEAAVGASKFVAHSILKCIKYE